MMICNFTWYGMLSKYEYWDMHEGPIGNWRRVQFKKQVCIYKRMRFLMNENDFKN